MTRHEKHATKLSEIDVYVIRDAFAMGVPQTVLANRFGVSLSCIRNVVSRMTWKHLPTVRNKKVHE